jgi:hypothetical protein
MTAGQVARLLGCKDQVEINGAFDRLAHDIYDQLGEHPEGLQRTSSNGGTLSPTGDGPLKDGTGRSVRR